MGASWGPRGASWEGLGGLWGDLGASWDLLGQLGCLLGVSWGLLGRLGCLLGVSWGSLGSTWGSLGVPNSQKEAASAYKCAHGAHQCAHGTLDLRKLYRWTAVGSHRPAAPKSTDYVSKTTSGVSRRTLRTNDLQNDLGGGGFMWPSASCRRPPRKKVDALTGFKES